MSLNTVVTRAGSACAALLGSVLVVLGVIGVVGPGEAIAQETVTATRTELVESTAGGRALNWQPPPPTWRDIPGGVVRLATQAQDGRYVTFAGGGLVDLVLNGEEIRGLRPEPLHLRARYTADEVCAGPILMIVPGRNVAGEETVLRIAGEPADAAWRKRHCKAKR